MEKDSLFEILRQQRNRWAEEARIKPFMVLHNKSLREIAKKKPATIKELLAIRGIGPKKTEQYGNLILETIKRFNQGLLLETKAEEKVFSVGEYIDFLNKILVPQRAVVQGEVGEVKHRKGYTFFKLLDKAEKAVLDCFVWQNRLDDFGIELKEGLEIRVVGFPKIFKPRGSFSFEVEHIGLVGEGALKQAFEVLKRKLAMAGFFAKERKKPIPTYVERVGLITSGFGDAKNDFLTHLGNFGFKIYFYDVRVEGFYAVEDLVSAIRWFNENMLDIEILVLTRGGGSLESLQAFNSEALAKAIFGSKIPVITGIGHENDETIADLVADFHASTPTHAARVLSDPWRKANLLLDSFEKSITGSFDNSLNSRLEKIGYLKRELTLLFERVFERYRKTETVFLNSLARLENQISQISFSFKSLENSLMRELEIWLKSLFSYLTQVEEKLNLVDPISRLKQGYSIVYNKAQRVIKSTKQIKIGESLDLRFYQGGAASRVEKISS